MERPTCKTCPYWLGFGNPCYGDGDHSDCRRHPAAFPTHEYTLWTKEAGAPEPVFQGVWPETGARDWCGEHPRFKDYIASLRADPVTGSPRA